MILEPLLEPWKGKEPEVSSTCQNLTCNDPFNRHRPPTVGIDWPGCGWSRTLDRSPVRHVLVGNRYVSLMVCESRRGSGGS